MKENNETKRAVNVRTADGKQAEEKAARKRLAEMGLLDDFLFGAMVTYPGIGEQFVRMLLKIKKALPRRMRFYHAKITARSLSAGADYDELKNVIIIMIMPYDPFGLKRMIYTVKNRCVEVPEMEYEDGAETVFLYTGGTQGVPNEGLQQLLHYMENTTYENAVNKDLHEIHRMVEAVKNDPEVIARNMIGYLKRQEEINRTRKEVDQIREELDRTRKELNQTSERSREEGKTAGDLHRLTVQICKKMKMGQPLEKIAEDLVEETAVIEPIYNIAEKFAPEYNPDQVFEQVNAVIKNSCSGG